MKKLLLVLILLFLALPAIASAQPWCGVQNLYMQNLSSGIDGFKSLNNYASGLSLVDENVSTTIYRPPALIDSYLSPVMSLTGTTALYAGLRIYGIYDYVDRGVGTKPSYFFFNVSVYHTDGTETPYYNITSVAISSYTPVLDTTYFTAPTTATFAPNDRILIRVYGYTTGTSLTTIHFLNQGTTPTYIQSGYFDCPEVLAPTSGSTEGLGAGAIFGIIGGIIGSIIIARSKI
jgi:hypothetical protein